MKSLRILVLAAALLGVGASAAEATFTVRLGILTCRIEGGAGFIVGSQKLLGCVYRPFGRAPAEAYAGSITKLGIDIGATGASALAWLVIAPTNQLTPGFLEGRYFGVTAEATPGVGVGGNVLLGGWDRSIMLQPISLQGQVGVNIAAGVAGLRLKSPPPTVILKR